jgi:hypothetical protein
LDLIQSSSRESSSRSVPLQVLRTTVLLKSIRQPHVTRVLDVTNFGTLSRVTEALDEYTFRHGRFKILVQGCLEQFSLAVGTFHSISCPFSRFLPSNLTDIVVQSKFNLSWAVKNAFSHFTQGFFKINCSHHS